MTDKLPTPDQLIDRLYGIRDAAQAEINAIRASVARAADLGNRWEAVQRDLYPNAPEVLRIVAAWHHVDPADMLGRDTKARVVRARQAAMWVLREHDLSYPVVGRIMGRDHTTVMYSCRKIEADPIRLDDCHHLLTRTWSTPVQLRAV